MNPTAGTPPHSTSELSNLLAQCANAACGIGSANVESQRVHQAVLEASAIQTSPVEAILDLPDIPEEAFVHQLANSFGYPYISEEDFDIEEPLHNRFPARIALRHRILPLPTKKVGQPITLATYDPFDLDAKQAVGVGWDKPFQWAIASRQTIMEALRQGYGVGAENFDELVEGREDLGENDELAQEVNVLDEEDEDATVLSFVNQVFRQALTQRATDIHVEPLENDLRIRYRVDGALEEVTVPPNIRMLQASLISRLKIMANLDIAERRLPQDGRINLELDGSPIDVRVATIPSVNGESVSLRLLRRERFDFDKLGFSPNTAIKIRELLARPNGIILVTGPTGSGKSTTLYTFLRELNTKDTRIVTIEDPVENKLDGIVQIAVKPEIDLSFASGLRSILRGDPNIVMIGEMRDLETTEIAIRAALTGHLVFSTLHTNDAVGGISRLVDMGVEPFLISSSVQAFLAQRLVRTLCPNCRQPSPMSDEYLDQIGFPAVGRDRIMSAVGCRDCRHTGFIGRMAIVEICEITPQVGELITTGKTSAEIKPVAIQQGMRPMRDYGWEKVIAGETTVEEVITATSAS